MKKLIIIELIFCLFCFSVNWYQNSIISYFTIFTYIILKLALFISLLVLLISMINYLKNNKGRIYKTILFILLIMAIFLSFYDFSLIKTKVELKLYEKQRDIIIQKVKNNEFSYYSDKNIKLPIYKYVSSDGEIYVYQNNEEQVISFWISRGFLSGSIELIYSSTDESLIYKNEGGHPINKIIELKEHWYYVITDY